MTARRFYKNLVKVCGVKPTRVELYAPLFRQHFPKRLGRNPSHVIVKQHLPKQMLVKRTLTARSTQKDINIFVG